MSVISWLSCAGTVTFNTSPLPNANVWSAALGSRCEASSFHGYSGLRKVVASWGCSTSALSVKFSEVCNGTGVLIAFLLLVFEGGLFICYFFNEEMHLTFKTGVFSLKCYTLWL